MNGWVGDERLLFVIITAACLLACSGPNKKIMISRDLYWQIATIRPVSLINGRFKRVILKINAKPFWFFIRGINFKRQDNKFSQNLFTYELWRNRVFTVRRLRACQCQIYYTTTRYHIMQGVVRLTGEGLRFLSGFLFISKQNDVLCETVWTDLILQSPLIHGASFYAVYQNNNDWKNEICMLGNNFWGNEHRCLPGVEFSLSKVIETNNLHAFYLEYYIKDPLKLGRHLDELEEKISSWINSKGVTRKLIFQN